MTTPCDCLVVLDVDRTHEYVFHPPRLRLIRGASFLIDDFIRRLEERFLVTAGISPQSYRRLYSNGGAAEFLFDNPKEAEQFVSAVEWRLKEITHSASITGHVEVRNDGESFHALQRRAMMGLRMKKRSRRTCESPLTSVYAKHCTECGIHPASVRVRGQFLCLSCKVKNDNRGQKNKLHKDFEERNPKMFDMQWPDDFSDIARKSRPENYLGLIYADVNRMGEHKRRLLKDVDDPGCEAHERLAVFSEEVERALFDAACKTVAYHVNPIHYSKHYPAELALAGGDDLILLVPAHTAVPIALDLCLQVEEESRQLAEGIEKLTISVGVVLAKGNFPVAGMIETAKELLLSAKTKAWQGYKKNSDFSVIDFQLLDSGMKGLEQIRRHEHYDAFLDARPYTTEEMNELMKLLQELKRLAFPVGRLKELYRSRLQGPSQGLLDYLLMLTRIKENQRSYLLGEVRNVEEDMLKKLPEILELYDFVQAS